MQQGGRLSAEEKGKQKATADDAGGLPPALVLQESEGEPPRPAGDAAAAAAAANWHAGGSVLPRHLLLQPSGTSEIEEAPPSPPRAPPSRSGRLPALNAEEHATAALAAEAFAGLVGRLQERRAALDSRLRELEQLRRELRSGGFKDEVASKQRREGAGDDEPEPEVVGKAVQLMQHQLGMQDAASRMTDTDSMLALRLQAEEFWKPVVPVPQRGGRSSSNNNRRKAEEEMKKALEEFWKPVPVPQRNNSKINWERIISLIALISWLVPCYIILWTLLPANITHMVGTISVLWILRSAYPSCQRRFRTSRTISRHVPRLVCVCFWLLVLYVLYLALRPIHGTFAGWLGKHINRDSDGSTSGGTSS